MRYLLIVLTAFTIISCEELEILRYEYHTTTQMGKTVLAVTQDSVTVKFNGRGEPTYWGRAVKQSEWNALGESMADVDLSKVSSLPAPTNNRATDRSPYAKFVFVGKDSTVISADFDAGKPNDMLRPLMNQFLEIDKSTDK